MKGIVNLQLLLDLIMPGKLVKFNIFSAKRYSVHTKGTFYGELFKCGQINYGFIVVIICISFNTGFTQKLYFLWDTFPGTRDPVFLCSVL